MQLCFAEVKSQLMLDGNWFLLIVLTSKCKRYQVEQLDANNNTPRATSMTISITTRRLQLQTLINLIEMLARINKMVETLSEPRYLKVWCIYFETKIASYKRMTTTDHNEFLTPSLGFNSLYCSCFLTHLICSASFIYAT